MHFSQFNRFNVFTKFKQFIVIKLSYSCFTNYFHYFINQIFYLIIVHMLKINNLLVLIALVIFANSIKLMLIGGAGSDNQSDIYQALAAATNKKAFNCGTDIKTTKCPIIAVATSAASSQADGVDYYNNDDSNLSYKNLLLKYGFFPIHILNHIDTYKTNSNISTQTGAQNLQYIKIADIIFFNGGDQSRHSRCWLNNDGTYNTLMNALVKRAASNQVVVAGTSAGTMIMPKYTFGEGSPYGMWYFHNSIGLAPKNITDADVNGTNLKDVRNGTNSLQCRQNGGKMYGFNFVSYQTDSHTNARGRVARLVANLFQFRLPFGVAVDQNTAFLSVNEQIGYVYGQNGVTIVDISHAKLTQSTYFQVNNVTISYLTAKDSYNFSTNTVITSKPLIDIPRYNSFTDSSDIMSPNQISLLLTRLVDQKPAYNVGSTKTPSSFPKGTPTFQMVFSRNDKSKGYYDAKVSHNGKGLQKKWIRGADIQQQSIPVNSRYSVNNITLQMTYK